MGMADIFIIFYPIVLDFALICSYCCYCFLLLSHFFNTLQTKSEQGSLLALVSKFHI